MENQNNNEYGQTDPDFIDQNTLVDGSDIQNKTDSQPLSNKENKTEFGESDPDYIDQNTLVDTDNYARDEDPYQYQEEFIEDLKHPENDFETNTTKSGNQDQFENKNDGITNAEKNNDLSGHKE
ncbi:hypothetical protein [Flavobacterium flavigenum]|uniref:hypothetical protein n=1 Tax=Flavobacterium flavigenum TaxID=3003258 RepID=UPI0022AC22FA|nr:hypothetical protein [Flavobacterium flavigenum]